MRRREVIAGLLGCVAVACAVPSGSRASAGRCPADRLSGRSAPGRSNGGRFRRFRRAACASSDTSRAEISRIEYRHADGRPERCPALAAELVRLKVDLIVTRGTPATLAAKAATGEIPIVMLAHRSEPLLVVTSLIAAGRKRHGPQHLRERPRGKARRADERAGAEARAHRLSSQHAVIPSRRLHGRASAAAQSLALETQLLDVSGLRRSRARVRGRGTGRRRGADRGPRSQSRKRTAPPSPSLPRAAGCRRSTRQRSSSKPAD